MSKEESLIPSVEVFYFNSHKTADLPDESTKEIMKAYGEEVRRITIEEAKSEARKQLKYDRTEEGVWNVLERILNLNDSDKLKIT